MQDRSIYKVRCIGPKMDPRICHTKKEMPRNISSNENYLFY